MVDKYTGQCACSAIRFAFDVVPEYVADCYCRDCQRSSGAVMATYFAVPQSDFKLVAGSPKSYPYVADSGKKLKRNFCPDCGCRVFTTDLESFPGLVFVMLGSLDAPEQVIPPVMEIFTWRRLPWTKALDVPQYLRRPGSPE